MFFGIGIILLPSAFPISCIFLFCALISSISLNYAKFLDDRLNRVLMVFLSLLIISNFIFFFNSSNSIISINKLQGFLGLSNWIPQILCFWFFQQYLSSSDKRVLFAKYLLIGSIPVIFSFITQLWFGWYGPYRFFFDLIIWFQRETSNYRLTGLLSNANYSATWLGLILPISISFYLNKKRNFFLAIFVFFIFYFGLLTGSRSFILSTLLSIGFVVGIKILLLISAIGLIIYLFIFNNFIDFDIKNELIKSFTPWRIFSTISDPEINKITRIEIYQTTLDLIRFKPLWGWGATAFPLLYEFFESGKKMQHSHNILLEITFNYGTFVTISFLIFILILIFKTFQVVFFDTRFNSNINKAFFASSISVLTFQFTDFTYYEGKISIISWIILSTLNSIIIESKEKKF